MKKLLSAAVKVRKNAYAPYSKFKVGAALTLANNKSDFFTGCNVENASYGGTICAERAAIFNAVQTHGGKIKIKDIVVVTDSIKAWPPCGFCRQVIAEFSTSNTKIHIANLKGIQKTFTINELLPESFSSDFLK